MELLQVHLAWSEKERRAHPHMAWGWKQWCWKGQAEMPMRTTTWGLGHRWFPPWASVPWRRLTPDQRQLTHNRRQMTPNRRQLTHNRRQMTPNRRQMTPNRRQLTPNRRQLTPN